MLKARQSTAIIVTVGPVLDADGVAVTDSVVGDFKASKNGAAPAALNGSATLTHRHTGYYSLSLTTTDTNTVGTLEITCDDTVNACPIKELQVIEEPIYDALYAASANAWSGAAGSSIGVANVTQLGGVAQSLTDLKDFADDGYDPSTNKVQGVVLVDTMAGTIQTLDALDTAQDSQHATTQAAVDALPTQAEITGGAYALDTDANGRIRIVDGMGVGELDTDSGTVLLRAATEAQIDAIEADTNELQVDDYPGRFDTLDSAIAALNNITATDVWAAATRTLTALDEDSTTIDLDAAIRAALGMASADLDTQIAALPTQAEITGGAYALNTDSGGNVKISDGTGANQLSLTSGLVDGITGTINTLDALDTAQDSQHTTTQGLVAASALRAALGLSSANLDTQLGDLPTAAENAAALLASTAETGVTVLQLLRAVGSAAAGEISDAGEDEENYAAIGNPATPRLSVPVDASGNRSGIVLTL